MAIPGKKLSQPVTDKAIEMLSTGEYSHTQIADRLNISTRTSKRINKTHKNIVDRNAKRIALKSLPLIEDNHYKAIKLGNDIYSALYNEDFKAAIPLMKAMEMLGIKGKDILKLSDTKEQRGLEIVRILATRTGDNVFMQFLNQTNNVLITDDMQEFMRWKLEKASRTFNIPGQGSEVDPHE